MPYRVAPLLALLFCCVSPGRAQGDFLPSEALSAAGLVKYWQLALPLDPGQTITAAHAVDDALYVGTSDGYAYAIDAFTGAIRWLQPVTRSGYLLRRPAHAAGLTIFATPVDMQSYDRLGGGGVGRREFRFPAGSGLSSDGDRVFLGGLDGRVYAFDARSLLMEWRFITRGPVNHPPMVFESGVFVADDAGHVFAANRRNKAFRWQSMVSGAVQADVVVGEEGLYVAGRDQSLTLFDLQFGKVRWRALLPAPLRDAPVVTPDTIYQHVPGVGVAALETGLPYEVDERVRWVFAEGRAALGGFEDNALILTGGGEIAVVDKQGGAAVARVAANDFTMSAAVQSEAAFFLFAADGRMVCVRPAGAPPIRVADIRDALRGEEPATTQPADTSEAAPATQPAAPPPIGGPGPAAPIGGKSKISKGFRGNGQ